MNAEVNKLLFSLLSGDYRKRYEAWGRAAEIGAPAVAPLARLVAHKDDEVGRSATKGLHAIAYRASRPGAEEERAAVCRELVSLLDAEQPLLLRREVLYLLAVVGGEAELAAMAAQLQQPDVREDARLAIENLGGTAAQQALRDALAHVPEDFRPHLEQSLRQMAGRED